MVAEQPLADRETDRVHARAPASQERSPDERPSVDSPPLHDDRQPTPRGGLLRRHRFALMLGLALFVTAATAGYLYWDNSGHFESTDDAHIAARQFAIQPKISGYITAVPVTDNQHVAAGDVIARIDDRDYRIALEQAQAQVANAEANISNIDAQINAQQAQASASQAQVEQAQAALVFAQQQAGRYEQLAQKGSGTVQNAQQYASQQREQQAGVASAHRSRLIDGIAVQSTTTPTRSTCNASQTAGAV